MKRFTYLLTALAFVTLGACDVNESIIIPAGAQSGGGTTVNGLISVEEKAIVNGGLSTVNGSIEVGKAAQTDELSTVNGSVTVAEKAQVGTINTVNGGVVLAKNAQAYAIDTVNGGITLRSEAVVATDVTAVNGKIELYNAVVEGDIRNVNGGMLLAKGSVVKGDLLVEQPTGFNNGTNKIPRIVIGPGTQVEGTLRFERPVTLYVHETAKLGPVVGVEIISYTSDQPPQD